MRPVEIGTDPEQRPILRARVETGPQIFIHPMDLLQTPEINVVCKILGVIRRGHENEDWNPTEEPFQAVIICGRTVKEIPPVGTEVEVTLFDDFYRRVVSGKRVARLVINRYPQ